MASRALEIMNANKQPHLPCGLDKTGNAVMLADVADADGRVYRVEFQATPDAKHCIAFVRHNPWSRPLQDKNAGVDYSSGHVAPNGFVCLGDSHSTQDLLDSPYPLDETVKRMGYFVNAFSYMKETGKSFPQPK